MSHEPLSLAPSFFQTALDIDHAPPDDQLRPFVVGYVLLLLVAHDRQGKSRGELLLLLLLRQLLRWLCARAIGGHRWGNNSLNHGRNRLHPCCAQSEPGTELGRTGLSRREQRNALTVAGAEDFLAAARARAARESRATSDELACARAPAPHAEHPSIRPTDRYSIQSLYMLDE